MEDEELRPRSYIAPAREAKFIENLLATIEIQRKEIERLEDELADEKNKRQGH